MVGGVVATEESDGWFGEFANGVRLDVTNRTDYLETVE
jgi:hypothetical protein